MCKSVNLCVLIPYTAMFCYRMFMKNACNDAISFIFFTFFSKMKCIVFSALKVVTFQFFSSGRDFFLVFKYVYVYICFL